MEGVWTEYQNCGYDTQRLFRDLNWKERGVDHVLIGHMWRLAARHRDHPTELVLASGDGQKNEFGTSFVEVLTEVLSKTEYEHWTVSVASFDWERGSDGIGSPLSSKIRSLVQQSPRAKLINLMDHYAHLVYIQKIA